VAAFKAAPWPRSKRPRLSTGQTRTGQTRKAKPQMSKPFSARSSRSANPKGPRPAQKTLTRRRAQTRSLTTGVAGVRTDYTPHRRVHRFYETHTKRKQRDPMRTLKTNKAALEATAAGTPLPSTIRALNTSTSTAGEDLNSARVDKGNRKPATIGETR